MKTVFTFLIVTMAILTGWLELRPPKTTISDPLHKVDT